MSDIENALKVGITTKNRFTYTIGHDVSDGSCTMRIDADFPLFKDGYPYLWIVLDKDGKVTYVTQAYIFG